MARTGFVLSGTCLNEPLSQQVHSLGHRCIVLRQELDDIFWRPSCLEIPGKSKMAAFTMSGHRGAGVDRRAGGRHGQV